MSNQELIAVIRGLDPGKYGYRAYMSSALSNLSKVETHRITGLLERLCLELFEPFGVFLYLPHVWSSPSHTAGMSAEDVYFLDRLRIAESDFVVVCADYPSFGVGQEMEIAQSLGLPILAFQNSALPEVSRMLRGAFALTVNLKDSGSRPADCFFCYENETELVAELSTRVRSLIDALEERTLGIEAPSFPESLRDIMKRENVDNVELARRVGFSVHMIDYLISDDIQMQRVLSRNRLPDFSCETVSNTMEKFGNPGLYLIRKVADALNVDIAEIVGENLVRAEDAQRIVVTRKLSAVLHKVCIEEDASFRTFLDLRADESLLLAAESRSSEDLEREARRALAERAGGADRQGDLF